MNVTVFGATGAIKSLTVAELLSSGHTVTAHARNATKVPATWGDKVRVVIGEMSDAGTIGDAVRGADVVISALGPSMDGKAIGLPLVEGTGHILDAMKRHNVTRYIGHGTPSILDPARSPPPRPASSTSWAAPSSRRPQRAAKHDQPHRRLRHCRGSRKFGT